MSLWDQFYMSPDTMEGPGTITYQWKPQYRVTVATSNFNTKQIPIVQELDINGNLIKQYQGSGDYWFDRDSRVRLLAPRLLCAYELHGWQESIGLPEPYTSNGTKDQIASFTLNEQAYAVFDINQLQKPIKLNWDYGTDDVRYETVTLGDPIRFVGIPETIHSLIFPKAPYNTKILEGAPANTNAGNAYRWEEKDKEAFPLRPGKYRFDWELSCGISNELGTALLLTNEVTVKWPSPAHYRHVANTPAVELDRVLDDNFYFIEYGYGEQGDKAQVDSNKRFSASSNGRGVFIFSRTTDGQYATGDPMSEDIVVRVVETFSWKDKLQTEPYPIGEPITSRLHDTITPHNGYLYFQNQVPYNPGIYDRATRQGPIILVNQQFTSAEEDDPIVVWYKSFGGEPIFWPYQAIRYIPRWPQPGDRFFGQRIVIASRYGSDGLSKNYPKDARDLSAENRYCDDAGKSISIFQQQMYDTDRYQNVTLYNQPDRSLPGYNPNEEHALIKPSFCYQALANRPPAAFALRNDLNRYTEQDKFEGGAYTSEPYVLVQYYDNALKDWRMAVYAVEQEDKKVGYLYHYPMKAGDPVAPYPLDTVIGATIPSGGA